MSDESPTPGPWVVRSYKELGLSGTGFRLMGRDGRVVQDSQYRMGGCDRSLCASCPRREEARKEAVQREADLAKVRQTGLDAARKFLEPIEKTMDICFRLNYDRLISSGWTFPDILRLYARDTTPKEIEVAEDVEDDAAVDLDRFREDLHERYLSHQYKFGKKADGEYKFKKR